MISFYLLILPCGHIVNAAFARLPKRDDSGLLLFFLLKERLW